MIISRTPFRISFFGGGTDFPGFFNEHGGAVLNTTIDKYCYLSAHHLTPFFKHRFRASYAKTESVINIEDFEHPLVRETMLLLDIDDGIEISHVADLPGRTGLGTSSSFTVGLLNALHTFFGRTVSPEQLAMEAVTIERDRVGDTGGWQDQYAAAFGGLNVMRFSPDEVEVETLHLPAARSKEFEQHLLLFYMGKERSAELILQEQKKNTAKNTASLRTMLQMVDHATDILQGDDSIEEFGKLMHESWMLKKSLSNGISTTEINDAYQAAQNHGALGGKLLGAGGGGFLCLFAPPACHQEIRQALQALNEVNFALSRFGSRIIFMSDV